MAYLRPRHTLPKLTPDEQTDREILISVEYESNLVNS